MKSFLKKENFLFFISMFAAMFLVAEPAFAAGGTGNISSFFESIKTILTSVAVVVVTIAVMWAGYKMLFGGSSIREVGPVVLGAVVIGSSAWIASQLVGS